MRLEIASRFESDLPSSLVFGKGYCPKKDFPIQVWDLFNIHPVIHKTVGVGPEPTPARRHWVSPWGLEAISACWTSVYPKVAPWRSNVDLRGPTWSVFQATYTRRRLGSGNMESRRFRSWVHNPKPGRWVWPSNQAGSSKNTGDGGMVCLGNCVVSCKTPDSELQISPLKR